MNKWQLICPLTLLAVIAVTAMHSSAVVESHTLTTALARQLDGHSLGIANLLGTMRANDPVEIEDAIYQELQGPPAMTSLITRPDVHVMRTSNGLFQCTIDTARYGMPSRTIRQSAPATK
jgi:hypothetical protein